MMTSNKTGSAVITKQAKHAAHYSRKDDAKGRDVGTWPRGCFLLEFFIAIS